MSDDRPSDSQGAKREKCHRCGGSGTESETYQEHLGGASSEMITKTRNIACNGCGGSGYAF